MTTKPKSDDVFTMPIAELQTRVRQALDLLSKLDGILPGLIELPEDSRRHSAGRYRTGEAEALSSLLDLAKKKPALFETLADDDAGKDPTRFEADLVADRLHRAMALAPLVQAAESFAAQASDTRLHLGDLTRPVLLAMYEIAKPHAKRDPQIASICKPAIDFYQSVGRAAAATRAKKRDDTTHGAPTK
jgi:hypothetical protein